MTRLRCLDCQDGRHCRHSGYVPAGIRHALVENDLGTCIDCGQPPPSCWSA